MMRSMRLMELSRAVGRICENYCGKLDVVST